MAEPTLFDGLARATDPQTSHDAAHEDRTILDTLVARIFASGSTFTDSELAAHPALASTPYLEGSIRTSRSRLTYKPDDERHADGLIEWTGERRRGATGRRQNVYALRRARTAEHDAETVTTNGLVA